MAQPPDCENVLHELIELKVETHTTLLAYTRVGDHIIQAPQVLSVTWHDRPHPDQVVEPFCFPHE